MKGLLFGGAVCILSLLFIETSSSYSAFAGACASTKGITLIDFFGTRPKDNGIVRILQKIMTSTLLHAVDFWHYVCWPVDEKKGFIVRLSLNIPLVWFAFDLVVWFGSIERRGHARGPYSFFATWSAVGCLIVSNDCLHCVLQHSIVGIELSSLCCLLIELWADKIGFWHLSWRGMGLLGFYYCRDIR